MEVWEIKVLLLRSNPTLIRQFTVSGERTLKDVSIILKTLLEWHNPVGISFGDGKKTIPSETKVKDAFQEKNQLFLNFTEKTEFNLKWIFRLTFLGKREQQEDYPRIIRYRGANLPEGLESTRDFNCLQMVWSGTGFQFYSLSYTKYPKEKYMFSAGKGNLLLKQKYSEAGKTGDLNERLILNYEDTIDVGMFLANKTIAELYALGERLAISKPKGKRKQELVAYYTEKLAEPESLAVIIKDMTLNQYRALKRICVDEKVEYEPGAMDEVLRILDRCGYADFFLIWDDYSIDRTRQLLLAYEQWLDQTDEKEFQRLALLRSTILGCVRLYGGLEKSYWKEIASKVTGRTYTDQELEAAWTAVRSQTWLDDIGTEAPDFLYYSENLDMEKARRIVEQQPAWGRYIPRVLEIKQLETGGLRYPARLGEELERVLAEELGVYRDEVHEAHYAVYRAFQYGQDPDAYAERLVEKFHCRGTKTKAVLKKLFAVLKPITRQVLYGGYKQNEMGRR